MKHQLINEHAGIDNHIDGDGVAVVLLLHHGDLVVEHHGDQDDCRQDVFVDHADLAVSWVTVDAKAPAACQDATTSARACAGRCERIEPSVLIRKDREAVSEVCAPPRLCEIMGADTRLKLGIALLILGLVMPAGTLFVTSTDWPDGVKGVVSAFLLLGFEIMMVPAVALMGKENFDRIVAKAKGVLKSLKPSGGVSRGRYRLGLVMFVGPLLYAWVAAYVPALQPEDSGLRLWLNLGLDLTVASGLFVLGGDFWDKLRALFVHEARAVFPPPAPET